MANITNVSLGGNNFLAPDQFREMAELASERAKNLSQQKTPKRAKKARTGKGGIQFAYINRAYAKAWLDKHFPFHNISVIHESARLEGGYASIVVRLEVATEEGITRVIQMYGSKEAIVVKETGQLAPHPYFKSAETDAIKRCAVWLGCANDVYGNEELDDAEIVGVSKDDISWVLTQMPRFVNAVDKGFPAGNIPLVLTSFLSGKVSKSQIEQQLTKFE
jgi:hypothetical protein